MENAAQPATRLLSNMERAHYEPGIISSESVLNLLKLFFAGGIE